MFLGKLLVKIPYFRNAAKNPVDRAELTKKPPPKVLLGIILIAFSFIIGWPMVGFFAYLAFLYDKAMLLFIGGFSTYILSWIVWAIGTYLAGPAGVEQGALFLRYVAGKLVKITGGYNSITRPDVSEDSNSSNFKSRE